MQLNLLFYLAIFLFTGVVFSKLIRLVHLPDVTGYLIGGLIVGPAILGLVPGGVMDQLSLISDVALGFIAFSIGGEFKLSYFKRVGIVPIVIAFFESVIAVVFVVLGLLAIGQPLPFALVLGAIAAATAPAATIMVIKQYKAKGPVTETLLSVVALDDAVALIAFGLAVAVAKSLTSTEAVSMVSAIVEPVVEVLISVGGGLLVGAAYTYLLRFFKTTANRLALTIGVVFITSSVASALNLSGLLTCMSVGAAFANFSKNSADVFELTERITPPIFMLFFVFSGADLDISILPSIGLIGVIYILLRPVGKFCGAWLGGKLTKAPDVVCKYLGPALLPQAGVAIGLTFVAQQVVPEYASIIRAVILSGTLIYELLGPVITKLTLTGAGEIVKKQ